MSKNNQEIASIAQAIERYLSNHESAADSLENVAKWWLGHQRYHETMEDVRKALDYLVANGKVAKSLNIDGSYIYSKKNN